jgi:hypothetical protein
MVSNLEYLCFNDFSAENISFKIDEIERISKSPGFKPWDIYVSTTFQPKIFRLNRPMAKIDEG